MNKVSSYEAPDLVVNICPFGCNIQCLKTWINESIGHKIVCRCPCGHNKKETALAGVEGPVANARGNESFQEGTRNDYR